MKKNYCGTHPVPRTRVVRNMTNSAREKFANPFNSDSSKVYQSLGSKIRLALETGESVGVEISPGYDGEDSNDMNVLSSFKHDVFDIAEQYGKLVDSSHTSDSVETKAEVEDMV